MPFDPNIFLNQNIDDAMDTVGWLCPQGEHRAMVGTIDEKAFQTGTSDKNGKDWLMFKPAFLIQDPTIIADSGREQAVVYHNGMFVDIDETTGRIKTEKNANVELGRLRDAVGQNNQPGWNFMHLQGAGPVMVKVAHVPDKNNPEKKYARVVAVRRIT